MSQICVSFGVLLDHVPLRAARLGLAAQTFTYLVLHTRLALAASSSLSGCLVYVVLFCFFDSAPLPFVVVEWKPGRVPTLLRGRAAQRLGTLRRRVDSRREREIREGVESSSVPADEPTRRHFQHLEWFHPPL